MFHNKTIIFLHNKHTLHCTQELVYAFQWTLLRSLNLWCLPTASKQHTKTHAAVVLCTCVAQWYANQFLQKCQIDLNSFTLHTKPCLSTQLAHKALPIHLVTLRWLTLWAWNFTWLMSIGIGKHNAGKMLSAKSLVHNKLWHWHKCSIKNVRETL